MRVNVIWHLDHPQLGQLMLFRPVPDWQPSAEAYAMSVNAAQLMYDELRAYHDAGLMRADVDPRAAFEDLSNMVTGVVARHLSNEPGVGHGEGRTSRGFPALIETVIRSYQP